MTTHLEEHVDSPAVTAMNGMSVKPNVTQLRDQGETEMEAVRGLSKGRAVMLASMMMLTYFMMAMSVGSSLIIIPVQAKYFGVSELAVQWISSSFALAYGWYARFYGLYCATLILHSGLLVAGRLADLYGRRQLFLIGLTLGLIANIVSGVILRRIPLCVVRAIAGLGLSIASPAGFGIVGVNFRTEPGRTMAFAALGVGSPAGAALGQILGGVMSSIGPKGWQYLYFVIAGFNLIPIIGGYIVIPREPVRSSTVNRKVDWIGAILITVAMILVTFSITQSGLERQGWRTLYVSILFSVAVVLIIAFGFWEHHIQHKTTTPPIVKLGMFTRHKWRITAVLAIAFLDWCGICGWVYLTSVYYQNLLGYSPLQNALHILPGPITGMLCSYLVTLLAPRVSAPTLLVLGAISTGLANCLFAIQNPNTPYWKSEFLAAILHPFGGDLTIPIGSILISNLCDDDEQSVGGALFQVSLQLATAVDVCLSSLIHTQKEVSAGLLVGLRDAFWFNTALCWLGIPIILISLGRVGLAKDVAMVN